MQIGIGFDAAGAVGRAVLIDFGRCVATCPAVPGCISKARLAPKPPKISVTLLKDILKSLRNHGDPIPPIILEEVIEVSGR
jgi:hypothetical protein